MPGPLSLTRLLSQRVLVLLPVERHQVLRGFELLAEGVELERL